MGGGCRGGGRAGKFYDRTLVPLFRGGGGGGVCDRMLREGMVTLYCLHLAVWGGVAVFFLDMRQLCRKSHHVPGTACWGWQMALEVPVAAADCWKNLKTQRRQHTTGYQIQSPVRKAMHFHNCLQPAASRSFAFFFGSRVTDKTKSKPCDTAASNVQPQFKD